MFFHRIGAKMTSVMQTKRKQRESTITQESTESSEFSHSDMLDMKAFMKRFKLNSVIGGGAQAVVKSAVDR